VLCYESIIKSVIDCYPELVPEDIQLGTPPALEMGDVAIPAFIPAKKRKVAPHVLRHNMGDDFPFFSRNKRGNTARPGNGRCLHSRVYCC